MKLFTIVGARPQFIKASVVSKAIQETSGIEETIVHTGQHYDANMSDVFFNQLCIPKPHYQLNIHGGSHGEMTGKMLAEIEQVIQKEKPDRVLVYGDTNSTLAGALAAVKLHVPVAHVESGLRSFNMQMPEEINRILTDNVSDLLFCPTNAAVKNLRQEGFEHKLVEIINVGDVMQDAAFFFADNAKELALHRSVGINKKYILATVHRAENTDDINRLSAIVEALNQIHRDVHPIIIPLHPRTQKILKDNKLSLDVNIIDPVGYLEMISLISASTFILTDSGGLQKEAYFFKKPCITLRDETEWSELVNQKVNFLVGANKDLIIEMSLQIESYKFDFTLPLYGYGNASQKIIDTLLR